MTLTRIHFFYFFCISLYDINSSRIVCRW